MKDILAIIGFVAVILWLFRATPFPSGERDDTDPPGGHSGLILFTDHLTGVQYVGTLRGGLTPRVDAEGRIVTVAQPAPGKPRN